jgi:hypothetical protein
MIETNFSLPPQLNIVGGEDGQVVVEFTVS